MNLVPLCILHIWPRPRSGGNVLFIIFVFFHPDSEKLKKGQLDVEWQAMSHCEKVKKVGWYKDFKVIVLHSRQYDGGRFRGLAEGQEVGKACPWLLSQTCIYNKRVYHGHVYLIVWVELLQFQK